MKNVVGLGKEKFKSMVVGYLVPLSNHMEEVDKRINNLLTVKL